MWFSSAVGVHACWLTWSHYWVFVGLFFAALLFGLGFVLLEIVHICHREAESGKEWKASLGGWSHGSPPPAPFFWEFWAHRHTFSACFSLSPLYFVICQRTYMLARRKREREWEGMPPTGSSHATVLSPFPFPSGILGMHAPAPDMLFQAMGSRTWTVQHALCVQVTLTTVLLAGPTQKVFKP